MKPAYRTFDELELELGEGWVKDETEAPSGICVIFTRTWPCGCTWSQAVGVMMPSKSEYLFSCSAHTDFGFKAEFKDGSKDVQRDLQRLTWKRKGKIVTPDMLPTLVPGQLLRARSVAWAAANPTDLVSGADLVVVREGKPLDRDRGVTVESTGGGIVRSVGVLTAADLDEYEVRLVTRHDEKWPTEPVWVLEDLESSKVVT